MANTNLVIDMITREILRIAHEKASFLGTIDRSYDESFAKTGAKIGDTLRIRKPERGTIRTGRTVVVQDSTEENTSVTVATQKGFDLVHGSAEMLLDIDDFVKRKIEPRMAMLISSIEAECLATATKATYNLVGTDGTVPNDMEIFGNARTKLNQSLAPKDDMRSLQLNSVTMAKMVGANKGLFQDSTQIKEQYREGLIGRLAGADWYENERTYALAYGSDHTTVTVNDGSIAEGDSTITTAGANVTVGTVFTFSGDAVKAVHPETKAAYSHDQQFVVTAVSGNDWTFDPPLYTSASGGKQNVSKLPTTGSAITVVGTASATRNQDLMYHKEAFTFVTADLPLYDNAEKCVRKTSEGLSFRVWQAPDIRNDELITRVDILYGFKVLRPEWACRITS